MEKIYEHIVTTYNTDFYKNSNSLEPIKVSGKGLFGDDDDWSYTAKSIGTKKHPHFEFDSTKGSLKDVESFTENYGNPLCGVQMSRRILCVERTDEKVAIKLFFYTRLRKPGKPYFVKSTVLHFITYNYKTNSLYTGSLTDYHLKRKCRKSLRRVSLAEDVIELFKEKIKGFFNTSFVGGDIVMENFDTSIPIKKFVDAIPDVKEFDSDPKYTLYKHFLTSGGVKLPNNWKPFIEIYPQPKKTDYKKVGFKYVDAFMNLQGMKGDKLKRVLHTITNFNVTSYNWAVNFFGSDFILSKPDSELKMIIESGAFFGDVGLSGNDGSFTKSELNNIYQIFLFVCSGVLDYSTIVDHFNFRERLDKYQPVKWKSKTLNDFIDEHDEWSKLISSYTTGITTRIYGRQFIGLAEKPIMFNGEVYYPKVLTNTDEYNNESNVQTNCVRTYVDRPDCFIISLRKGGLNSLERLTIEFALTVVNDDLKIKRVQTKAKRNSQPDISWSDVLDKLDERVNNLHKQKLFTLPEKIVEYKLGLGTRTNAIIYNLGDYSTIIWEDKIEKIKLHQERFNFQHDFDDLPL